MDRASTAAVAAGSLPNPVKPHVNRIGILAGGGRLPLMIADSVLERGGAVHIVAIDGEADPAIARFPHTWVNWGQVGRMVALLRSEGGGGMVIAGSVRRPDLWKLRPDWGFFASLRQILAMLRGGDDSVLSRVVRFFEAKGLKVLGAHEVAPDLLAGAGQLGTAALNGQARADAELGFAVRAALGPLDAGQAVVVADGKVLAIEGAEGTDAMLRRVAGMRSRAGSCDGPRGVLAKGPKPGQELRVDMPAIGPRTAELAAAAGLVGIAAEAGAVLLLDRSETIRAADASGIAIEGLPQAAALPEQPATVVRSAVFGPVSPIFTRRGPSRRDRADIEKGLAAILRLSAFDTGQAVVVARAYILAIAAGETTLAMLERIRELRQWGIMARRRRGVLVCRASGQRGEAAERWATALIDQSAVQGLAGVAVLDRWGTREESPTFSHTWDPEQADRQGLFVVECFDDYPRAGR
jgi:UDP-2,3-diacylglucosamine hydrolase